MNDKRAKFRVDFGSIKTIAWTLALVLLAACGQNPSAAPEVSGSDSSFVGLLKVDVSGADTPNPTATAQFVDPRTDGVQGQAATVVPISRPGEYITFSSQSVSVINDTNTNTRRISIRFGITNSTSRFFSNLTLYAVSRPSNIGGTGLAALTSTTGAPITSEAVARSFQPSHVPNPALADLQLFTRGEVKDVTTQAINAGILTQSDTALQYGYVARNLSGSRLIFPRTNLGLCTVSRCMGVVNLSYKFPLVSPAENNPTSFQLLFLVADETTASVSQSLEEHAANTVAGLTNTTAFAQTRILAGSTFGRSQDNTTNLCQVRTAVATAANPSSVLMPSSVPTAPGSLDMCFGSAGKRATAFGQANNVIFDLALQPDGKIIAVGQAAPASATSPVDIAVVRYNPNGSLDSSFGNGGKVVTNLSAGADTASSVSLLADGKIVVAGVDSNLNFALLRYLPNGSLDTSFGIGGTITTQIGTGNSTATAMVIQPDARIVLAGSANIPTNSDFALVRYLPNGSLDTGFGVGGKVITNLGSVENGNAIVIQPNGKLVLAGRSNNNVALLRYNPNGSLDTSFGVGGKVITNLGSFGGAEDLVLQTDGKFVVVGQGESDFGNSVVLRYNPDGSLDPSFDADGILDLHHFAVYSGYTVALQADGKILVASHFLFTRLNPDGSKDTSFNGNGEVRTGFRVHIFAIALQSDGKILLGGQDQSQPDLTFEFTLFRYNP